MNKNSGFYKNGKSHADGGIPVLVDDNTPIEVEQFEYKLCNNAMNSTKIFEFKDKTNKEILDEIFRYSDCEFEQHKANSGDFIICKLAVMDKKKRNITGTAKEIINVMQSEKSCNVSNDSKEFKDGGEIENDETYTKWKNLVNMSKSELQDFYNSKDGKEAGLSSSEASEQGISSGRESARWIMKMKDTPKSEWTPTMWKWANKQISFISRMSGMKGDLYDDKGNKTRKHTSLLIWGHNPKKYNNGGEINTNDCAKYIKENENVFKNGYYSFVKKMSIYADSYGGKIPEIDSLIIISYNSIGQNNLKVTDTINSIILQEKIGKLIEEENGIPKIIISKHLLNAKRVNEDIFNLIKNNNVIIIDRDEVVYSNIKRKFNTNEITVFDETKYDDNGKDCYWKTYTFNDSSISIDYCLGDFFKIDSIGTKEKSRRSGDASKLIDYAKEIALQNNFQKIDVYLPIDENTPRPEYTLEDYKKAVSFYKKNGFEFYTNSTVKMFCDLNKILKDGGELKTNEMENKSIGDLKFTSYEDGMKWIENESKKYQSKNHFYASNEYKLAYPIINNLAKEEKKLFGEKGIKIMNSLGINFGDSVYYDYVSPFGFSEEYTGIVINKNGVPYVKLDKGQETMSGKKSVIWNKGWVKNKTKEMENKETLKGGKADKLTIEDIAKKHNVSVEYAKEQLNKGMKIESEHTKDTEKQKEIALDHLSEFIEYYKELDKMEEKLKQEEQDKTYKVYDDIKSCLIVEGDDENSYIFEGKEFINKESGRNERWKIISFFKYGVNVSHLVNFKLTNKSENSKLTFEEIREAYKDGLIEIDGIENETILNNCLKLLTKCIDIIDANEATKSEIEKHNLSKQEIEKLKSKILEIEEKSKKEVEKLVEPIEIIEPETIIEIEESSERKEFLEAINTFEEFIKLGGTDAEIKEWQEAVETLKMLL